MKVNLTICENMRPFFSGIDAPDGYTVEFAGKDYRDTIESLDMLLNDYSGFNVIEMRQTNERKKRLSLLLIGG